MDTTTAIATIEPITRRTDAGEVATAAYEQLLGLLETLSPDDWNAPTECPGWNVGAMVGHLIGAAKANASVRENLRQMWWGRKHRADFDGNDLDALNALQVADHADLAANDRLALLKSLAPAAVRGRMATPRPLRAVTIPSAPGGSTAPGMPTKGNVGQLMDVIYTRDVWLHTIDIARATGRKPDVNAACNARIVADVVAEWGGRHGQPVALTLTGPSGGVFHQGTDGQELNYDAVDFCRILSGREDASGLLQTRVFF